MKLDIATQDFFEKEYEKSERITAFLINKAEIAKGETKTYHCAWRVVAPTLPAA
jgi:hypothetical protein